MNINLSKAKPKKLQMGLNQPAAAASRHVFGDDDSETSNDDNNTPTDSRAAVNQALRNEQEALRKRAQQAASAGDNDNDVLYDYDGAYDSFHPSQQQQHHPPNNNGANDNNNETKTKKSSRYISDLLQAAEQRKRHRDVIYERKVLREQQAEDAELGLDSSNNKFVTAGYKRKLQERELWQAQEAKQLQEEQDNSVTKRTNGTAMATFYGNLNRNVAMGGGGADQEQVSEAVLRETSTGKVVGKEGTSTTSPGRGDDDEYGTSRPKLSFMEGFVKSGEEPRANDDNTNVPAITEDSSTLPSQDPATQKQRMREIREQKVKEARVRYLQRRKIGRQ